MAFQAMNKFHGLEAHATTPEMTSLAFMTSLAIPTHPRGTA